MIVFSTNQKLIAQNEIDCMLLTQQKVDKHDIFSKA